MYSSLTTSTVTALAGGTGRRGNNEKETAVHTHPKTSQPANISAICFWIKRERKKKKIGVDIFTKHHTQHPKISQLLILVIPNVYSINFVGSDMYENEKNKKCIVHFGASNPASQLPSFLSFLWTQKKKPLVRYDEIRQNSLSEVFAC